MTATYPEAPEAVAWELTLTISEAEGRPIRRSRQRQPQGDTLRGLVHAARSYYLDLYAECYKAASGAREAVIGAAMMH